MCYIPATRCVNQIQFFSHNVEMTNEGILLFNITVQMILHARYILSANQHIDKMEELICSCIFICQ